MTLREAAQALLDLIGHAPPQIKPDVHGTYNQRVEALYAALALPPEPGWAEGARAMRAGAWVTCCRFADGCGPRSPRRGMAEELAAAIRGLPVPPAPARAPEKRHCVDPDCRRELPATWFNSLCAICSGWDRSTEQYQQAAAAPVGPEILCPVPNCHAGMLRDPNGRETVSCPVCDGTITADSYRSLEKTHGIVVRRAPEVKAAESAVGWVSTNALSRLRRREGGIGVSERPAGLSDGDVRVRLTVEPAPVEPDGAEGAKP